MDEERNDKNGFKGMGFERKEIYWTKNSSIKSRFLLALTSTEQCGQVDLCTKTDIGGLDPLQTHAARDTEHK